MLLWFSLCCHSLNDIRFYQLLCAGMVSDTKANTYIINKIALGFITHIYINPLMIDDIVYKPSPYALVFIHDKLLGLRPRVYHLSHQT